MKATRYYIMSLALAFTAMGCSDDITTGGQPANAGDEVQFGVALSGVTRTVYGDETNTGFPIYWVNGDKVKVASPQCNVKTAEYRVSVDSEKQNYATSLTKTGDAGVQWGSSETADFYSVYPSDGATLNVSGNTVTASLKVASTQHAATTEKSDCFYAQPADMGNVMMYAKTSGVSRSSGVVDLQYKPFSTVIEFMITAPKYNSAGEQSEITVQSLSLTAPEGTHIAGNFTFNFPTSDGATPTISNTSGSNVITLHFLENNQYTTQLSTTKNVLKAKMCLMPVAGVTSLKDWKVKVETSAGTFTKNITESTGELKPGMVHQIMLPQLSYSSQEWTYDLSNWITSLPDYKNIYLTEVSLPGAWYAGSNEKYQATTDFTTLWNAGVRAFAVETRVYSKSGILETQAKPLGVIVSGSGENTIKSTYYNGTNTLEQNTYGYNNSMMHTYESKDHSIAIVNIINNIIPALNPDEFAVLVLSYADGGEGGHRNVAHGAWLELLYNEYVKVTNKEKIYQKEITPNTTINDVLGKLVIKINVDMDIAKGGSTNDGNNSYTYTNNLPVMFSYTPFLSQLSADSYDDLHFSELHWQNWDDTEAYRTFTTTTTTTTTTWCFNSANRTQLDSGTDTTIPKYENRKTSLKKMGDLSKEIYDNSNHNVWFYFNCGGTQATSQTSDKPSPTDFALQMNLWLLEQIQAKKDASPLGLVMFNQCTGDNSTYHGADIIKAIIEMNSKFYLKHAGDGGSSTGGNTDGSDTSQDPVVESAAPGYSSGMVDNNTDAFGWTTGN